MQSTARPDAQAEPADAPARATPEAVTPPAATTAQRAIKVLQSSSAPAQRSLLLRPRGAS